MAKDKEYQLTSTELAQRVTTPLRGAAGLSIIGPDGKPWTLAELSAWWGAEIEVVEPEPHAQAAYMVRAHELRVADGPATQIVRVIDQHGNPIDRAAVCRWWTDAPHLPALPAAQGAIPSNRQGLLTWPRNLRTPFNSRTAWDSAGQSLPLAPTIPRESLKKINLNSSIPELDR